MNLKRPLSSLLLAAVLLISGCGEQQNTAVSQKTETAPQSAAEETPSESETANTGETGAQVPEPVSIVPAVVLRDDASVWENENGQLSKSPITKLDMGSEVIYLGQEEELKSGNSVYRYSRVRLTDETEGWISSVRLARNAVPAVITCESGLYRKPAVTSPLDRNLPAGQIVAVSLEDGNRNGFAGITFSYYSDNKLSSPEKSFVEYRNISSTPNDIETAKLVLKAFRNSDQEKDFFNLALSLGSVFESAGTIIGNLNAYTAPDLNSEPIPTTAEVKLLAINPQEKGESLSWYLAQLSNNQLAWVNAEAVKLETEVQDRITLRPHLEDKTTYRGEGTPSTSLYQGLSFRKLETDKDGNESLKAFSSLDMGEVVYYLGEDREFNDINYARIEMADGREGWCSKSYLAIDALPTVVTQSDAPVFNDTKLTSLTPLKLELFQIVALHNDEESGFYKISYNPMDEKTSLQKEVFIQMKTASLSYDRNDIDATLLFQRSLKEEDSSLKDLYLRKAAVIPSFFQNIIADLYYEAEGGNPEFSAENTENS